MDRLVGILEELALPFAYDHFIEGEAPEPPFVCYLLPGSRNFAADGQVYHKINGCGWKWFFLNIWYPLLADEPAFFSAIQFGLYKALHYTIL